MWSNALAFFNRKRYDQIKSLEDEDPATLEQDSKNPQLLPRMSKNNPWKFVALLFGFAFAVLLVRALNIAYSNLGTFKTGFLTDFGQ